MANRFMGKEDYGYVLVPCFVLRLFSAEGQDEQRLPKHSSVNPQKSIFVPHQQIICDADMEDFGRARKKSCSRHTKKASEELE